jgi:hypothetical protein
MPMPHECMIAGYEGKEAEEAVFAAVEETCGSDHISAVEVSGFESAGEKYHSLIWNQ